MSRYLLDVNALVALGFKEHEFFERVVDWVQTLQPAEDEFAACAKGANRLIKTGDYS